MAFEYIGFGSFHYRRASFRLMLGLCRMTLAEYSKVRAFGNYFARAFVSRPDGFEGMMQA